VKDHFDWQVDAVQPELFAFPEASVRKKPEPAPSLPKLAAELPVETPPPPQAVTYPPARWERRPPRVIEGPGLLFGTVRAWLVSPVFWSFLVLLFIVIMTLNYRHLRHETFPVEWLPGEEQKEEMALGGLGRRSHTRLSDRRVLQLRLNWFLSRRKHYALALADVHSVTWRRYTNFWLLLVGAYFVGTLNPPALLLFLLGLEAKIYSLRFGTPFAQMPATWMTVHSFRRKQFQQLLQFYRRAQLQWSRVRTKNEAAPAPPPGPIGPDNDFFWGVPLWSYVGFFLVLSVVQRFLGRHVSFDDYLFTPLYLGVILAVAHRSRRDAIWAALLGGVALLTVKFPGNLPVLGLPWGTDGASPDFFQYLLVLAALVAMAVTASVIAKEVHALAGSLALIVWLAFVATQGLYLPMDLGLYVKCALAVAVATALIWVERAIWAGKRSPAAASQALTLPL